MRIAYLADLRTNNGVYRGFVPMGALAHCRGHIVDKLLDEERRTTRALAKDVDVLYIHRHCDRPVQRLAQQAKEAGAAVVWDNDDDIGSLPRNAVARKRLGTMAWERRLADMRLVFGLADLVTAPSRALADRHRELGASRTDVVENYLPDQFIAAGRRTSSETETTIGWIAGLEHAMDSERLPIADVLQRILDERPAVRVVSIGLGLGLRSDRYRHIDSVPLLQLPQHAATFDIAIAPLADLAFSRARSNIKLKEYAAAGAPWLASPVGPYRGLGEQQGGRLVQDDDWYEAITRLIDKPRERRKLSKRAGRWAAGETFSKNVGAWETMLSAAIDHAGR